jgi:two-component system LytT family sensor kinase
MTGPRLALWLLGPLTAIALVFSSQIYMVYRAESVPMPFRAILLVQMCHWYVWLAAGPMTWFAANRWPLRTGRKVRNVARHIAIGVVVSLVVVAVYAALAYVVMRMPITRDWFPPASRSQSLRSTATFFFTAHFHVELVVYGAIFAIAHAMRSTSELRAREREALQLSSQLATARLQVLTAQLQPHFLFNTLHTIGSLILQHKNNQATEMLAELGELLRITLDRHGASLITLGEELDHLRRYLHIEETRFGDRLTVMWHIDAAALDVLVPPLILQPVVENALKHGVAARMDPTTVDIRATTAGGRLRVSVYNDGPLLRHTSSTASSRFGLRNVRERLATLDAGATLTLENVGTSGVRASVDMRAMAAADEQRGAISA